MRETFRYHENSEYHKNAVVSAQNFLDVHDKKAVNIGLQLNQARRLEIEKNVKILSSIIETIIFIGRPEIASRGHRDAGPILLEHPLENDGNRSLLRFRMASGDQVLMEHMDASKLQYTSPKIQNELIEIGGSIISEKIASKINDETTNISGIAQFSLCARYLDKSNESVILREDFLTFLPVEDASEEGLLSSLKETCIKLTLNLGYLVGQGYDGASAMRGEFNGCAVRIKRDYPQALYVHCASHSLNLAIGDACSVSIIRNSLGTILGEIINFFRCSAKRQKNLNNVCLEMDSGIRKRRLTKFCETRWVERFEAIICKHSKNFFFQFLMHFK